MGNFLLMHVVDSRKNLLEKKLKVLNRYVAFAFKELVKITTCFWENNSAVTTVIIYMLLHLNYAFVAELRKDLGFIREVKTLPSVYFKLGVVPMGVSTSVTDSFENLFQGNSLLGKIVRIDTKQFKNGGVIGSSDFF